MGFHARPFVGVFKSQFTTVLSIFDNNFPQNGSKNEETAPRTRTGYPHEGPSVEKWGTVAAAFTGTKYPAAVRRIVSPATSNQK